MTRLRTLLALCVSLVPVPAAAASASAAPADIFAIIVTSNRTEQLGRPELQYADDDGVRYYELFSMIAPRANLFLLTELDQDTRRLFPELATIVRPPTVANLRSAAREIAGRVQAARSGRRDAIFYFVFAGHGDVDRGQGFVELGDGPFRSGDVERLLTGIGASRSHVILDSCNSFFVLNPRKPGGRRFATPEDAALRMGQRLPGVGVFLSTSAEAEVFEWSALQSGVFSHAVRSGLAGAADADRDDRITYEELEAFVSTATADIRNPIYRPRVFARGPGDARDTVLWDLSRVRARRLSVAPGREVRLAVRDGDGIPWAELHKEAEAAVAIALPERLASSATVEEVRSGSVGGADHVYAIPGGDAATVVDFDRLARAPTSARARGPRDAFRALFARPFGPRALARHRAEHARQPAPVFGISQDDVSRMDLLLRHTAQAGRKRRWVDVASSIATGGALLGVGAVSLRLSQDGDNETGTAISWMTMALGLVVVSRAAIPLATRSDEELIYDQFRTEFRGGASRRLDHARTIADTETRLDWLYIEQARSRRLGTAVAWLIIGGSVAGGVVNELTSISSDRELIRGLALAAATGGFGWLLYNRSVESPSDRMIELWRDDPVIRRLPRLSAAPIPGGAAVAVEADF